MHYAICPFGSAVNITRYVPPSELLPYSFVRGPGRGKCHTHDWHETLNWYDRVSKGHPMWLGIDGLLGAPPTLAYYLYRGLSARGYCRRAFVMVRGSLKQLRLSWVN